MSLSITQYAVGGFDENFSYLITHTPTNKTYIVDPSGTMDAVYTYISTNKLTVAGIVLTHSHRDHYDALEQALAQYSELPIYVHERGIDLIGEHSNLQGLVDYQQLPLGDNTIRILHTPGHTDDSVCLYIEDTQSTDSTPHIITGDTLFVGGCGRTSAHQVKDLYESLQELKALPEDTVVYPGHNYGATPASTIGYELQHNRFYQAEHFNAFKDLRLANT